LVKAILSGEHAETCPLRALGAWCAAGGVRSGAVFRAITPRGRIREAALSDRTVARIVKRAAIAAGIAPHRFAGRSLRAGFMTEAYRAGIPERKSWSSRGTPTAAPPESTAAIPRTSSATSCAKSNSTC
jgi:hypothetical protein